MAQLKPVNGTDYYLWKFLPSIPASAVFLVLFLGITIAHCWRLYQTRCWFCIAFAIGGLCQVIGYGVRIYCYYHTNNIASYAIQSSFIVLAPVFYAASIYMVLGRLIRKVHGERFSIIRPSRLTKIFVAGDILCLNIQGNAVGLTAKDNLKEIGEWIITGGLILQLLLFGLFMAAALVFHLRMKKHIVAQPSEVLLRVPWRQGLMMLYVCSALIMVRSVFRLAEYIMGVDGYLLSTEWPMYVFDTVLMWIVQVVFFVWFPDKLQPTKEDAEEEGHGLVDVEVPERTGEASTRPNTAVK